MQVVTSAVAAKGKGHDRSILNLFAFSVKVQQYTGSGLGGTIVKSNDWIGDLIVARTKFCTYVRGSWVLK